MKVAADYQEGQTEVTAVTVKTHFATLRGGSYDPDQGDSIRLHKKR